MKFKKIIVPKIEGKTFDINETTVKAGQPYVYYERIQAARPDTEITKCLEKYGCIDKMVVNKELLYMDITELKNTDMRSLTDYCNKANDMWNKLPAEIKEKFENNRDIFVRDGEKWLESELKKENKLKEQEQPKQEQTNE